MRLTLKKNEILRSEKEIRLLFSRGIKVSGTCILFYVLIHESKEADVFEDVPRRKPAIRVFFRVSKKHLKKAVLRNKIRRQLREIYRLNKSRILEVLPDTFQIEMALCWKNQPLCHFSQMESDIRFFTEWIRKRFNQSPIL